MQFLPKADSNSVRKEAALKKESGDMRKKLQDIIGSMDLNRFLETLSVADQATHRPKVEPRDMAHPRFYWVFKNMDYDQWFDQDSAVLLLSGPTSCALDHVSSHILGLMEQGSFGKDGIVLNFFSLSGAARGNIPIGGRDSEKAVTIFVHTLLHQLISSPTISRKKRISTASGFLSYLLDSLDSPELLDRFGNISLDDPSAVLREALDIPDKILWKALGKSLEGEKGLQIVVNVPANMRGRDSGFIAAVSTFVEDLGKRTEGLKVLLTIGPSDDSGMAFGELPCIKVHYDKERRGLIGPFFDIKVSNIANSNCRVP
jgi:hypothetical protein